MQLTKYKINQNWHSYSKRGVSHEVVLVKSPASAILIHSKSASKASFTARTLYFLLVFTWFPSRFLTSLIKSNRSGIVSDIHALISTRTILKLEIGLIVSNPHI